MTARQCWEYALTELSKVNAPSLLLHEFNYYFNKALYLYINKRYNIYDVNLLTTDDLRVLKATTILTPTLCTDKLYEQYGSYAAGKAKTFGATYEVILPADYLHMLNCICIYKMNKTFKCYDKDDYVEFAAKRLTADSWSVILNDYYNRPLPERPYYYIHNVNTTTTLPTNLINTDEDTDLNGATDVVINTNITLDKATGTLNVIPSENDFRRKVTLKTTDSEVDLVEKPAGLRYGNPSGVRCEIRYGKDNSVFSLQNVFIDYIKVPLTIRLTKEQVDLTEDTSQIMEFPDYVCQEIINELVTLLMARDADPRLQVLTQVSLSIATPTQQLTQPALVARATQA